MAFNRYMRICRSEQQYKKIFSPRKSRALLAFVWIFVVCYTATPKLAGIQDFVFVPGYAQCAPTHLTEIEKLFHYAFAVIFFLLIPLLTTIFSYIKVTRTIQQHNVDASTTTQRRESFSHITTREIKTSKSLFAVIFAFMICWVLFGLSLFWGAFVSSPRCNEMLNSSLTFACFSPHNKSVCLRRDESDIQKRIPQNALLWTKTQYCECVRWRHLPKKASGDQPVERRLLQEAGKAATRKGTSRHYQSTLF